MKKICRLLLTLVIMIGLALLYLFVYMKVDSFQVEPFIVFLGIELFIVLFIKKMQAFLSK